MFVSIFVFASVLLFILDPLCECLYLFPCCLGTSSCNGGDVLHCWLLRVLMGNRMRNEETPEDKSNISVDTIPDEVNTSRTFLIIIIVSSSEEVVVKYLGSWHLTICNVYADQRGKLIDNPTFFQFFW